MKHTSRKLRRLQRGQAIVIIALAMIGLVAFAMLAIDGGRFYDQRRVSQNASDMAAMAGAFKWVQDASSTETTIISEINRIAELNYIPDSDGITANSINTNVQAWWVDSNGDPATGAGDWTGSEITAGGATSPANTAGVKVRTRITYNTFMGGVIGRPQLTVQTDSIAKQTVTTLGPFDDPRMGSMFVGGSDCNNLTDRIAHAYDDTNSAKFLSKVYVNGTLVVGDVSATRFYDDVQVRLETGTGPKGGPYTHYSGSDPFAGNGNQWDQPSDQYIAPNSPPDDAGDWPRSMYVGGDTSKGLIDAEAFRPGSGYYWKVWKAKFGLTSANANYTYFNGTNSDGTSAYDAGTAVHTAWKTNGKRGVFFVDGDLEIHDKENYVDTTIVTTGRFITSVSNIEFYTAVPGDLVSNISVLAGADLGTTDSARRCASDRLNWVMRINENNTQMHGIVWVPHGQILFDGNTSGGSGDGSFSDGIVAYSVRLGGVGVSQAQSWQFKFDASKFVIPVISNGLVN